MCITKLNYRWRLEYSQVKVGVFTGEGWSIQWFAMCSIAAQVSEIGWFTYLHKLPYVNKGTNGHYVMQPPSCWGGCLKRSRYQHGTGAGSSSTASWTGLSSSSTSSAWVPGAAASDNSTGSFWNVLRDMDIYFVDTLSIDKSVLQKKDDLVYSLFCTWEQRVCLSLYMDQSMGWGTSLLLLLVQLCSITIPDHQLCMVNRVSSCCRAPSVAPTFSQTYI